MNSKLNKDSGEQSLPDTHKENPVAFKEVGEHKWGEKPADNYGYASEEERLAKRGMEDWEMVENIPKSQKGVPVWFLAVIVAVLLVAIGLSFPFWGDRVGYERVWVDWGFGAAILYLIVFGGFVFYMVNHYSPSVDGMEEDVDPSKQSVPAAKQPNNETEQDAKQVKH
jgi:hypothetical protein